MSPLYPWFGEALTLCRVYDGPVPESGRKGSFVPSHFTVWHLREGGFRIDLNRKTIRLKAPLWMLMSPVPRRQTALPGTRMTSIHFQIDAGGPTHFVTAVLAHGESWCLIQPIRPDIG